MLLLCKVKIADSYDGGDEKNDNASAFYHCSKINFKMVKLPQMRPKSEATYRSRPVLKYNDDRNLRPRNRDKDRIKFLTIGFGLLAVGCLGLIGLINFFQNLSYYPIR